MAVLNFIVSNLWAVFLIVLFFGGSIFVHELGHFLAARRRGMHVERFSIGFGPKMFGWVGRDGVEYRVSWLPLGGYVALPQLADMSAIEGETRADLAQLKPASYTDKMVVAVAGAVFNVVFAFGLATILWIIGQPSSADQATTRIGYVSPTIELSDGTPVTSPAVEGGLKIGDVVRSIDGRQIDDWQDLMQTLVTGAERTPDGRRKTVFVIERDGVAQEVVLYPRLAGDEKIRRVGIAPAYELLVLRVGDGTPAAAAGFQKDDRIQSLDGVPILNFQTYLDHLSAKVGQPITVRVLRSGNPVDLTLPAAARDAKTPAQFGLDLTTDTMLIHENPVEQFTSHVSTTWQTLVSLIHPKSDIGISKLSGPVGIIRVFHMAAQADIRLVLWFTILVNINLAIFNLLPIPVLDGGHMLFATLAKVRGRALPPNFVATTQSVFMILLVTMILYVSVFDVRRIARDFRSDAPTSQAAPPPEPKEPAPAAP